MDNITVLWKLREIKKVLDFEDLHDVVVTKQHFKDLFEVVDHIAMKIISEEVLNDPDPDRSIENVVEYMTVNEFIQAFNLHLSNSTVCKYLLLAVVQNLDWIKKEGVRLKFKPIPALEYLYNLLESSTKKDKAYGEFKKAYKNLKAA